MDGTIFLPLMVIIPIICAILVNLLHGSEKITKVLAVITAICLPIVPLVATYGNHFFGGYKPLAAGGLAVQLPALSKSNNFWISSRIIPPSNYICIWTWTTSSCIYIRYSCNVCSIHIHCRN